MKNTVNMLYKRLDYLKKTLKEKSLKRVKLFIEDFKVFKIFVQCTFLEDNSTSVTLGRFIGLLPAVQLKKYCMRGSQLRELIIFKW
jgi:hypothetical protein